MQVARNQVVVFHYEMKNESGEVLGSSRAGDPVAVLYGRGGLVRGVDDALQGRKVGELVGRRAADAGVTAVVFDRGGFKYHGRVAAVADAAREAGLEF